MFFFWIPWYKRRPQKYIYFVFWILLKIEKNISEFFVQLLSKIQKNFKNNMCIFCCLLLKNLSENPTKNHTQFEKPLQKWEMENKTLFFGRFFPYKKQCVGLVISVLLFLTKAHVFSVFNQSEYKFEKLRRKLRSYCVINYIFQMFQRNITQ